MQILVIARRKTEEFSAEQFEQLLEAEAERVRGLYIEGTIEQIWSRTDVLGACFVLQVPSEEAAKAIVATLPLAQRGMLDIQIISLRGYRGFAPRGV